MGFSSKMRFSLLGEVQMVYKLLKHAYFIIRQSDAAAAVADGKSGPRNLDNFVAVGSVKQTGGMIGCALSHCLAWLWGVLPPRSSAKSTLRKSKNE